MEKIATYADIKLDALKCLGIAELRDLAQRIGVLLPLSKTHGEIIAEICKTVETEMNYLPCLG